MPPPTARDVALRFRAELDAHSQMAVERLVKAFGQYSGQIKRDIKALEAEIQRLGPESVTVTKLKNLREWRQLELQLQLHAAEFSQGWGDDLQRESVYATRLGLDSVLDEVLASYGIGVGDYELGEQLVARWNQLNVEAVIEELGYFEDGSPLQVRLATFPNAFTEHLQDAILDGTIRGYNPRKVARNLVGANSDMLGWATRWTRTVQLESYRGAASRAYQENDDVLDGWLWHATLDTRVCASCIAMHGTEHPVTQTLDDHWNGRCTKIPKVKPLFGLTPIAPDDLPDTEAWFKGLSQEEQEKILGIEGRQRWAEGQNKLGDFSREVEDDVWGTMRVTARLEDL